MPIVNLPFPEFIDFKETLKGIESPGAEKVLQLIKATENEIAYVFANQLLKPDQRQITKDKITGFVRLQENQVSLTRKELVMLECFLYLTIVFLNKFGRSDIVILYETLLTEIEDKFTCYLSETTKKRIEAINLTTIILEAIR